MRAATDSLADGIINKANSVADGLISTVDNIWDFGNGWIKDRKEDARKLIRQGRDAVKSAVNNARSWLKGQLTNIQNNVKSAISTFFETIKNAYRTGGEINQIIANAANAFRSAIDGAVRGANELVGKFKGEVLSAVEWTKNLGINIDKWGVKFNFNVYNQIVEPAVNAIAGGVSSTINGIGNSLKGITDWLEPRTQKVVADVVNALLGDQTGNLWNKINGVDAKIAATRTELERTIANKANELKNQMQSFLGSLGSEGKKILDAVLNFGNSPTGQFSIIALEILLGMTPVGPVIDIKDTIFALLKIADGDTGIGTSVELLGALAGWVPLAGDAIKSIAKVALGGALGALLAKFGPDAVSTASTAIKKTDWAKIAREAIEVIGKKWDDFVRAIKNAPGWAWDGLRKAFPWIDNVIDAGRKGVDKVKSVASWIGNKLKEAQDWLSKRIDDLVGNNNLKPLGRKSTGRVEPNNLIEKLAMEEIMSDPTLGRIINVPMTDPTWPAADGWKKMSNRTAHDVEIHYVGQFKNDILVNVDDFKFK